jgi:cellobiose-specific phosphotransferase system component IIB
LGNYWSGEQALAGAVAPLHPASIEQSMFSGVVSLCPMPLDGTDLLGPIHPAIEWLHLPISDGGMGDGEFAAALELCLPFVAERREKGNVLVHCAAGMSRSVSVIAAVLCSESKDLSVDDAIQRIAEAKARAVGAPAEDADLLVSPAWEFHTHLRRRFAESARRANGRS